MKELGLTLTLAGLVVLDIYVNLHMAGDMYIPILFLAVALVALGIIIYAISGRFSSENVTKAEFSRELDRLYQYLNLMDRR